MYDHDSLLNQFAKQLEPFADREKFWLGCSGGLDSVVLLHMALLSIPAEKIVLSHINHAIQPAASDWAEFVEQLAADAGVACVTEAVAVDPSISMETAARQARYAVWEQQVQANQALLLAHHADDQVETVLYRLLRGAGSQGLSGMPVTRLLGEGILLRPLLTLGQEQLKDYAVQHNLQWVEDPSNADQIYDRNFLRHTIVPQLKQRWPGLLQTITRTADLQAETAGLLAELAAVDVSDRQASTVTAASPQKAGASSIQLSALANDVLPWAAIAALPAVRQRNVIYQWLRQQAGMPLPEQKHIQEIVQQCKHARNDAEMQVAWGKVPRSTVDSHSGLGDGPTSVAHSVRLYRGRLYAVANFPVSWSVATRFVAIRSAATCSTATWSTATKPSRWGHINCNDMQQDNEIDEWCLPSGLGRLRCVAKDGVAADDNISVSFRQGGEKICLHGQRRPLKKVLQEHGVLPWVRSLLPLIYKNEQLVSVAGLINADDQEPEWQWHAPFRVLAEKAP